MGPRARRSSRCRMTPACRTDRVHPPPRRLAAQCAYEHPSLRSSAALSLLRSPANAFELDQARQVTHGVAVGELVHRTHLIYEHGRAERLIGHALVAEDRLDLILAATQRDNHVGMIVKVEIDCLTRVEIDLPNPHVLVLEDDPLPDFTERDAFFPGRFQS